MNLLVYCNQIYGEIENLKLYYGIKNDDFRIFSKGLGLGLVRDRVRVS